VAEIEVRDVHLADESALHAWWDVGRIASAHDEVDDYWPAWATAHAGWVRPDSVRRFVRLSAYDGAGDEAEVVGIASLQLEDADNTHLAIVRLMVLPERRGGGIGSALLAAVEAAARADARTTVLGTVTVPLGVAADDESDPNLAFARRHG
jgi:GNAT superfamily N-acetyltransferase